MLAWGLLRLMAGEAALPLGMFGELAPPEPLGTEPGWACRDPKLFFLPAKAAAVSSSTGWSQGLELDEL